EIARKIAMFCNVQPESVIQAYDVDEIYKMPLVYHRQGLDKILLKKLQIEPPMAEADLSGWQRLSETVDASRKDHVDIAFVGKYVNLQDAYKSVYEALRHAGYANNVMVKIHRI